MIATLDASELKALTREVTNGDKSVIFTARQLVRAVSFAVEKRIKSHPPDGMPVDTGRARASWGHGPDSIWTEEDGGLTITQGSNVEYVIYLEYGHSKQSPAGFIERAGVIGAIELEKALGLIDPTRPAQMPLLGFS